MKGKALFIAGIMIIVAFMNMNTMAWAPLSADFTWQPENPNDLQEVHFIDNSSGNIVIWVWYFGDGNSSTDVNPYHKYADNGSYNVTLIVISAYGNMDKITKQINISNVPPHAIIKVDAVNNKSNVNFSSLSYDDDGSIVNYTWQFGDGSTATGKTVSHIYANDGIYNINLTVKDNDGAENETNTSIMVDTTSPVTSYNLSCSGWCNGSVDVTFNATDNLSGVSKTYYKIDDGEWKEYNGSFTVTSEGIHKIYFYSTDNAGNVEEVKNTTVKIDTTKPTVSLDLPKEGYIHIAGRAIMPTLLHHTFVIGEFNAEATATDSNSGIDYVEFILNGDLLWRDYISPYSAYLPREFPASIGNKLKVIAYDMAGNSQESEEITYMKIL